MKKAIKSMFCMVLVCIMLTSSFAIKTCVVYADVVPFPYPVVDGNNALTAFGETVLSKALIARGFVFNSAEAASATASSLFSTFSVTEIAAFASNTVSVVSAGVIGWQIGSWLNDKINDFRYKKYTTTDYSNISGFLGKDFAVFPSGSIGRVYINDTHTQFGDYFSISNVSVRVEEGNKDRFFGFVNGMQVFNYLHSSADSIYTYYIVAKEYISGEVVIQGYSDYGFLGYQYQTLCTIKTSSISKLKKANDSYVVNPETVPDSSGIQLPETATIADTVGQTWEDVQWAPAPDPEPNPNPDPWTDPEPNPNPNPDTPFDVDKDLPKLKLPQLIARKFPFSIPWDIYAAFSAFNAPAEIPHFVYSWRSKYINFDIEPDFSLLETVALFTRWGTLIMFNLWLITATRKLIGAGE